MSLLKSLTERLFGRSVDSSGSLVAGVWHVTDISVPHPFARYVLELRADGALEWAAVVPTTDAGEHQIVGHGTWHTEADTLHYTSGASGGTVRYALDEEDLILDGLPATKIGPGVRCVLKRVPPAEPPR
jgi:hypothetical protein